MIRISGIIGKQYTYVDFLTGLVGETGPVVEVEIDSPGGSVVEGFSIYNALRDVSQTPGRTVHTRATGQCASIASIIFVAGDRRTAACPIMIHNPWSAPEGDARTLDGAARECKAAEKQMEAVYSERCRLSPEQLSELMDRETYLSQSQAVALGIATEAQSNVLALLTNQNNVKMTKEKLSPWQRALRALGREPKPEAAAVVAMTLDTLEGTVITVDREEGEPQPGDTARPDGVFTLPDGRVITIADGSVASIAEPAAVEDPDGPVQPQTVQEAIEVLEEVLVQLEDARAQAKTTEEKQILNAVRMAGGVQALLKKAGVQANQYRPATRTDSRPAAEELAETKRPSGVQASRSEALDTKLAEARAEAQKKRKK